MKNDFLHVTEAPAPSLSILVWCSAFATNASDHLSVVENKITESAVFQDITRPSPQYHNDTVKTLNSQISLIFETLIQGQAGQKVASVLWGPGMTLRIVSIVIYPRAPKMCFGEITFFSSMDSIFSITSFSTQHFVAQLLNPKITEIWSTQI